MIKRPPRPNSGEPDSEERAVNGLVIVGGI